MIKNVNIIILILTLFIIIPFSLLIINGLNQNIIKTQTAVILGNQVSPDGIPSPRLSARLDCGIKLYTDGLVKKIIVSGATGKEGFNEAIAMAVYAEKKGVKKTDIIIDTNGYNTSATAEFTVNYLKSNNLDSVIVVSQYFHNPRTKMAINRLGIDKVGTAYPNYFEWRDVLSVSRELIAYIYYYVK